MARKDVQHIFNVEEGVMSEIVESDKVLEMRIRQMSYASDIQRAIADYRDDITKICRLLEQSIAHHAEAVNVKYKKASDEMDRLGIDMDALRAENALLRETADRRDHALRLYGSQFEEYFQLAHKRPVSSSIVAMLCNMTERHSCEMSKAFTQDEIARRMATRAALASASPESGEEPNRVARLEAALETCIMAHDLPGNHCEMEQAIDNACAILYSRKPSGIVPLKGKLGGRA